MRTKEELRKEAVRLAEEHELKKSVIIKILNELDKEQKYDQKHVDGISAVNELLKEMHDLELAHIKITEEIKKN